MNKAYTDIEQSMKLAEILPIESADHHYVRKVTDFMGKPVDGEWSHPKYGNPNSKYAHYIVQNFTTYETIPCWSLVALLSVFSLPRLMLDEQEDGERGWFVCHYTDDMRYDSYYRDEPIDACYNLILQLKEKNLL